MLDFYQRARSASLVKGSHWQDLRYEAGVKLLLIQLETFCEFLDQGQTLSPLGDHSGLAT